MCKGREVLACFAVLVTVQSAPGLAWDEGPVIDASLIVVDDLHRFEYLVDLDGDSRRDVFGWYWVDDKYDQVKLTGWQVTAEGALLEAWNHLQPIPALPDTSATAVGFFDGDALEDFVLAFEKTILLFHSKGLSPPVLWSSFDVTNHVTDLVTADFDGNGFDDLAVFDLRLKIYLNPGDGTSLVQSEDFQVSARSGTLRLTEVDGDGSKDLMMESSEDLMLFTQVDGEVTGTSVLTLGIFGQKMFLVSGDIDNDLDEDIVVFGEKGEYNVCRRVGAAAFTVEPKRVGGPATELSDVDDDGDLDGVCCGGGGSSDPHNGLTSIFRISFNDRVTPFATAVDIEGLGGHHIAGVADLDGDGDKDLVGGRCVYYAPAPITALPHVPAGSREQTGRTVQDFDHDGDPDLEPSLDSVFRNSGTGSFVSVVPWKEAPPSGTYFEGPGFPGDFDDDGDTDLIVSHMNGTTFLAMRLLKNNGGGGHIDGGNANSAGVDMNINPYFDRNQPDYSLAADLDGDGDTDLAMRLLDYGAEQSELWFNQGGGKFDSSSTWLLADLVRAIADFNQDALPDLFVTYYSQPAIRFGLGNQTFSAPSLLPGAGSFTASSHLDAGDADNDGDVDIVTIEWSTGTLKLFENDGMVTFAAINLYAGMKVNALAYRTFITDVNDDGWNDVVAWPLMWAGSSSRDSATAVLLRNPSAPGYGAPIPHVMIPGTFADLDGDGDQDLIGTVQMLNRTYEGSGAGLRRQYGEGFAGMGGMVPTVGAGGPFRAAETASFHITGCRAQTLLLLAVGLNQTDIADFPKRGMHSYVFPWSFLLLAQVGGNPNKPGTGSIHFDYYVPQELAGVSLFHQVYAVDSGSPTGLSATQGLEIAYR